MSAAQAAELVLRWGLVPLWILAGLADWWCHRRTRIEATSGWPENAFHWLLFVEAGVGLLAAALLQVNAAVLVLVAGSFLVHELSTWVELRYTVGRREVRPFEQMVHSFMEILPLALIALLAVMTLAGAGAADFGLRVKDPPWPPAYLAGMGAAVLLLNVLPLAEEGWRCLRARRA